MLVTLKLKLKNEQMLMLVRRAAITPNRMLAVGICLNKA